MASLITTILLLALMFAVPYFGWKWLVKALTPDSIRNPEDEDLDPKEQRWIHYDQTGRTYALLLVIVGLLVGGFFVGLFGMNGSAPWSQKHFKQYRMVSDEWKMNAARTQESKKHPELVASFEACKLAKRTAAGVNPMPGYTDLYNQENQAIIAAIARECRVPFDQMIEPYAKAAEAKAKNRSNLRVYFELLGNMGTWDYIDPDKAANDAAKYKSTAPTKPGKSALGPAFDF